jgi:hypothetical protein
MAKAACPLCVIIVILLVNPIRDRAGPDAEDEHRQELAEQGGADVGGLAGALVHQQRDGCHLDPGPDVAEAQTKEEQPSVSMLQ